MTVKEEEGGSVALERIAVQPTALEMGINDEQTLTVEYTPANATNKAVRWESSDSTVVSVDAAGKLRALKAGTATITAIASVGIIGLRAK